MQWITLIGDDKLNLDRIRAIRHNNSVNYYDVPGMQSRYCVDFGKDHIFYDYQGTSTGDYEKKDLAKILFKTPHFIMMVY